MKHISTRLATVFTFLGLLLPSIAFAQQQQSIDRLGLFLLQFIYFIDTYLVPLLFAVAFIVFIYGIFQYFIMGGASEEQRDKGKQFMIWGFIGFFLMVSIWGIVNLLVGSFGFSSSTRPSLPTFGSQGQIQTSTGGGSAFPTAEPTGSGAVTPPKTGTGVVPSGTTQPAVQTTVQPEPAIYTTTPTPTNKCATVTCGYGAVCNEVTGICESNT